MNRTRTAYVAVGLLAALAGSSTSLAEGTVRVVAAVGSPLGEMATGIENTSFLTFEHFSGAPCGKMVAVARLTGTGLGTGGSQGVWVFDGSQWSLRARTGVTMLAGVNSTVISNIVSMPVLNDAGDVMLLAQLSGAAGGTGLVRVNADGQARLLIRFNTSTGAGSVPGVPSGVPFTSSMDTYRFSNAGPLFNSMSIGLLGPSGVGDQMVPRTFITSGQNGVVPPGLAVGVTSAQPNIAMANSGFAAQRVGSSGYGVDNQLSGFIMFDQWGSATFAVRDGSTPLQAMPGQVITSSSLSAGTIPSPNDPNARAGMNGSGVLAFTGRFGVAPVSNGQVGTPLPPVVSGTPAMFIKAPNALARMVLAQNGAAPGLDNSRFITFTPPVINAGGRIAFSSTLTTPRGSLNSIWTTDAQGNLRVIAMTNTVTGLGAPRPLVAGAQATFVQLGEPSINARGEVMFTARINSPIVDGGAATQSDTVCLYSPDSGLTNLLFSGQTIPVAGRGMLPVSYVPTSTELGGRVLFPSGNDDGQPTRFTDDGRVLVRATITGVGPALLSLSAEPVVGACCDGATCRVDREAACLGTNKTIFMGAGSACLQSGTAGACCIGDFDHNGTAQVQDLFDFVSAWISGDRSADSNFDGENQVQDLFNFLTAFAAGGC